MMGVQQTEDCAVCYSVQAARAQAPTELNGTLIAEMAALSSARLRIALNAGIAVVAPEEHN